MATQVQWRGGSTAEHATFTGAAREVTVDTQKKTLVVHDGSTAGGEPLLREDQANLPSSVTNGLYTPGTNQVALSTGGTGRLFVDASGNVEIAGTGNRIRGDFTNATLSNRVSFQTTTANSATVLQVLPSGTGTVGQVRLFNSSDANNSGGGRFFATSGAFGLEGMISGTGTHLPLSFEVGGSERLRITSAGLVGIGTSNPVSELHLYRATGSDAFEIIEAQSINNNAGLVVKTGANTIGYFTGARTFGGTPSNLAIAANSGELEFRTGPANVEAARLDVSGRFLIGATSAIAANPALQVEQTTGAEIALGRQDTSVVADDLMGGVSFWGRDTAGVAFAEQGSVKCFADGTHDPGTNPTRLVFSTTAAGGTSPTERMTIKNTGIVNIANAPVYADNTAATTGGLVAGDVYCTATGQLMITY